MSRRGRVLLFAFLLVILAAAAAGYKRYSEIQEKERVARVAAAIIPNDMLNVADASNGRALIVNCTACHSLEKNGEKKVGPSLFGIVGRPIASQKGYVYSDALKAFEGKIWTTDELYDWVHDPQRYAPGTIMSFTGMLDPQDRMDLVAYLITLK